MAIRTQPKCSRRFIDLSREIKRLRNHLLPGRLDPLGSYEDYVYTRVFAFRVLAHAEIESYLEDSVRKICVDSAKAFKKNGGGGRVIAGLFAFSGREMAAPPSSVLPSQPTQRPLWPEKIQLERKLDLVVGAFMSLLGDNHGIKEANLLGLLLPIGFQSDDLDNTWLSSMNSFGEDRGMVAHKSGTTCRATRLPDPGDEINRVTELLLGLEHLDKLLIKLRP